MGLNPLNTLGIAVPLHRQSGIPGKIAGALLVASNIVGCLPLLHSPYGCAFQRRVNPFNPTIMLEQLLCTRLTEVEAIMGGEEKLYDAIIDASSRFNPSMIMVISTCVPDIICDDMDDVVSRAREKLGIPIVLVKDVRHFRAPRGFQAAMIALAEQFLSRSEVEENSVNIFTFPIHEGGVKVSELVEALVKAGIRVNGVYFNKNSVDEVRRFPRAEITVVDHYLQWCREYERKLGMKFLTVTPREADNLLEALPYGVNGFKRLLLRIGRALGREGEVESSVKQILRNAESELERLRRVFSGTRIAAAGNLYGSIELLLIEELGAKCEALFFDLSSLRRTLKDEDLKRIVDRHIRTIERIQGYAPQPYIDLDLNEAVRVAKNLGVDLVVCGYKQNPVHFLRCGVKAVSASMLGARLRVGARAAISFYRRLARIIASNTSASPPLLGLARYSQGSRKDLPEQWGLLCELFKELYLETRSPS